MKSKVEMLEDDIDELRKTIRLLLCDTKRLVKLYEKKKKELKQIRARKRGN